MGISKGKWKTEEVGGNIEITTPYRQRDSKVCIAKVEVDFGDPFNQEQIDNARLIASSPALLEALELSRNFVYAYYEEDVVAPGLLVKIDAAIAAARGTV